MKKTIKFHTAAENIELATNLNNIKNLINQSQYITQIIHNNISVLRNICRCGAIDEENGAIVLFAENSSSFYKINQLIPEIEEVLYLHHISYNKLMIKVRPEQNPIKTTHKQKKVMSQEQVESLRKIARQIGREDLIKPITQEENLTESEENDFEIKL